MTRITFITPTYNQADYLAECIDSVLPQIQHGYEYIVVNDGSTDDTLKILSRYKNDLRLKMFTQENCGQVKTLNTLWSASTAEYLGYLSSDDILIAGALEKLLSFLDRNPEVIAVYPDFYQIDKFGKITSSISNGDFDQRLMFEKLVCQPGPCTIFRRSAFLAVGNWRSDLRITPDLEFWSRMSVHGTIARFPNYLAKYRTHHESQSTGIMSSARANEILMIPNIFAKTLSNSNLDYSYIAAVSSSFLLAGFNHHRGRRLHLAVGLVSIGYVLRVLSTIVNGIRGLFKRK